MTAPDLSDEAVAGLLERLDIVISREWGEDCELAEYVRTVASALRERAKRAGVTKPTKRAALGPRRGWWCRTHGKWSDQIFDNASHCWWAAATGYPHCDLRPLHEASKRGVRG